MSLFEACKNNDCDLVEKLIEDGAEINAKDESGNSGLFYATKNKNKKICSYMINKGADIVSCKDKVPEEDFDVLKFIKINLDIIKAVKENNYEMVKMCLEEGACVNASCCTVDEDGCLMEEPILHRAVANRNKKICRLLIEKGADVDSKTVYYTKSGGCFTFVTLDLHLQGLI